MTRRTLTYLFVLSCCALLFGSANCARKDLCPDDPQKLEAGACGCGVSDADTNGNGVPDCFDAGIDLCPGDPAKTQPGTCGCGVSDADTNGNGVPDCLDSGIDLCPGDPAKTQAGTCGCGVSDADANGNGIPDCLDPAPPPPITFFPQTCQDVQTKAVADTGSRPADGTYTLYVNADSTKPWEAFCRGMNLDNPTEYLTVVEDSNYSQIADGQYVALTSYRRFRIDPATLEINPLDDTFATNTGFDTANVVMPGTLTHIPGGWAEFQAHRKDDGPPALANVSLTGTPFAFSDSILANNLNDFFCEVTSTGDSTGTGASVASDLSSFHLMAINSDPADASSGVSTREVADCADLGPASTFTTASWPLQYVSP